MDLLRSLLVENSVAQAIMVLTSICALGMTLGKIKIGGVSLGISFVFFMGILAGHLGLTIDANVLSFVQSFGLVLFVYALGLQVGPGFFSSFGRKSIKLNLIGITIILLGTFLAILFSYITPVSLINMVGVLCGATTNTPALGAAQQTLSQMNIDQSSMALSCVVAYPLGVLGVIFAIAGMRRFVKEERLEPIKKSSPRDTYIATFIVSNEAIEGKSIAEIAKTSDTNFVISRMWREGVISVPVSDTLLEKGDRILVVTTKRDSKDLIKLFGEEEKRDWNSENINWNAPESQLTSKIILVTKPAINGRRLGSLRLRNIYGVNVGLVYRSGIKLLATSDLVLQMGDRVVVVGSSEAIKNVEKIMGNAAQKLNDPNLAPIFIGIILGVILGSVPIAIPGMAAPVKLGLAGGPMIMGMVIGTFGPRIHMVIYSTRSANLMLRELGLYLFLACIGLDAGGDFFNIVIQPQGIVWVLLGFAITFIPIVIVGIISFWILKIDFGTVCGLICGSMANPMALNYANDLIPGDSPAIAYATVYPLGMFLRVIIAQAVLILLL
ncbi:MAG TPA: putative transporter [Bacteroidetes bacterium]|nr:putative transporter [Bacteroidota bacterium]